MDFVIIAEDILYVVYRHHAAHCSRSSDLLSSDVLFSMLGVLILDHEPEASDSF